MNTTTELTYLHDALARLCKLYMAMEQDHIQSSDAQDLILEIKDEIKDIYSEIISITSDRSV